MPRPGSDAPHRILAALTAQLDEGRPTSIEAVARRAGISKGGLLHHYRTRRAMLTALVEREIIGVEDRLAAARGHHRTFAAAYLSVVLQDTADRAGARMLTLAAADPAILAPLHAAYGRWHAALEADGLPPGQAAVVRLAADGLWMSALYGLPMPPSIEAATTLLATLAGEA